MSSTSTSDQEQIIRIHLDIGPICYQLVSVFQPNVEHESSTEEMVELESASIGFQRNDEEE